MANTVSKIAVVYGVLWLVSFWFQNIIYSTVISGFGVVLLIVVAIGMDNLFSEYDDNQTKLKSELEQLRKEVTEFKKS
jgi:hypothetical protein